MRFILLLLTFCSLSLAGQSDSTAFTELLADYEGYDARDSTDAWGMLSEADLTGVAADLQGFRDRLAKLDDLTAAQAIDAELLDFVLEDQVYRIGFGDHRFPLDAEGGFLTGIVYRYGNREVNDAEALDRYAHELGTLPDYFAHQRAALARGLEEGKTNPARVVELVAAMIDRTLEAPAGEGLFYRPVANYPAGHARVDSLVRTGVYPAYAELRDYLRDDYLPQLDGAAGISSISDGKDYYAQRVRYFTTDDVTPEEVFKTGQREVARIRAEMEEVMAETGFEGSFAEFLDFLRTDPQFYAQSPEDLLERAAWITKRMEAKLPRYFDKLPRMPLTVTPVPADLAPNYTGGRYSPGSYGQRRAGAFLVNTYDLPSRPYYTLTALALHEGVPGHHTQMMLAAEQEDVSNFRRNLYLSAFGEGWGLYAEFLGEEAGMYETPYDRFGRLTYEMWRACRLVVDPGIHYYGWSRQRAVDFLAGNTALSLHEVNTEIDRYIGWPAQAVSYKMGELKIRELRRRAEERLGDDFDLAAFHSLILDTGAVTLSMLERRVEDYLQQRAR